MPSIIHGYEYDIFISYRHKDNKGDHWVTEFVNSLKTELEATFKEDISIYFDENPHDGLRETHDVDDSLKGKLKCLIFIPIISQTYCDPKSFAWCHEFLAFKKLASEDQVGLKVKLANGNIASRILPVSVHELDHEDKVLLENELGGNIRGIEFIFKSAGVIRPLKPVEDDSKANLNHTYYRDQINKVARSIKEVIGGVQNNNNPIISGRSKVTSVSSTSRKRIALAASAFLIVCLSAFALYYFSDLMEEADRSIAVLPFDNLNKDPEQDYFSNGITEDIVNNLFKISDLMVRPYTKQYKGTEKSLVEIGNELDVRNIVEGSVRRVGNQVRIVVNLIDTKTNALLWSETYNRELKDILDVQSEISVEIAQALEARLTQSERKSIEKKASLDITAYDYYLRAREIINKDLTDWTINDFERSMAMVNRALHLDPGFAKALALKGRIWFGGSYFGIDYGAHDSAFYFASKAILADPSVPDGYVQKARIIRFLSGPKKAFPYLEKAHQLSPNDPEVLYSYGAQLLRDENEKGAQMIVKSIETKYSVYDPLYCANLGFLYNLIGDDKTALNLLQRAASLETESVNATLTLAEYYRDKRNFDEAIRVVSRVPVGERTATDLLGWLYFLKGDFRQAINYWSKYKEIESHFPDSTQTVPFRPRVGMAYLKLGNKEKADSLFREEIQICQDVIAGKRGSGAWDNLAGTYYDLAVCQAFLGKSKEAVQSLDSAHALGNRWIWGFQNDPAFETLKKRTDYKILYKKIDSSHEFVRKAFAKALNNSQATKELKLLLDK